MWILIFLRKSLSTSLLSLDQILLQVLLFASVFIFVDLYGQCDQPMWVYLKSNELSIVEKMHLLEGYSKRLLL